MAKELKFVEDIVIDELFIEFVGKVIDEINKDRRNRPEPKEGYRYKKDGVDSLQQQGNFNKEFFLSVIKSIWLKKSNLPSKTRGTVEFICIEALRRARNSYSDLQR